MKKKSSQLGETEKINKRGNAWRIRKKGRLTSFSCSLFFLFFLFFFLDQQKKHLKVSFQFRDALGNRATDSNTDTTGRTRLALLPACQSHMRKGVANYFNFTQLAYVNVTLQPNIPVRVSLKSGGTAYFDIWGSNQSLGMFEDPERFHNVQDTTFTFNIHYFPEPHDTEKWLRVKAFGTYEFLGDASYRVEYSREKSKNQNK